MYGIQTRLDQSLRSRDFAGLREAVGVALIGIVLWGTLAGSMLPFILRRFGFDPAVSSAPFVATLVDVTGLVIYFSVAMVILRGTLL
jgi:magnesium transporter